ncbi:MAG TPA: PQQ-binding-like beta-propeller repeat protein, partial [Dehalococcoidia bacterium]|nr:PQQ-binding-like beta-propeller repeat protein [Dehalococcoidia bacterium]
VLAIASQDGKVYAFDPANGTPKWDYPYPTDPKAEIFASMVSDKDMLYVMPFNNRLIALDGRTGTPKWVYQTAN